MGISSAEGLGLTEHARARMRQRGISSEALECLLEHGREAFDHTGCTVLYFDKRARQKAARRAGSATTLKRSAGIYAVIAGNGHIVTVGHRTRRVARV